MQRSFKRDGTMLVDGRVVGARRRFTYESQTDFGKTYTTTLWTDDFVSCNCRGWATHKKCWHVADVASLMLTYPNIIDALTTEARAAGVDVALDPIQHEGTYYKRKIVL